MSRSEYLVIGACFVLSAAFACVRGQAPTDGAYVLGWNEGELLTDSQGRTTSITVSPEMGAADLSFWTTEIPPGSNIIVHRHDLTEEILFVHKGSGTLLLGGDELEVEEGSTIYVPRGTYHGLENGSGDNLVIAFVATPPDLVQFIRGISWPVDGEPKQLTGAEIEALAERYDSLIPGQGRASPARR